MIEKTAIACAIKYKSYNINIYEKTNYIVFSVYINKKLMKSHTHNQDHNHSRETTTKTILKYKRKKWGQPQ